MGAVYNNFAFNNTLKVCSWNIGGMMSNTLNLQNCLLNIDICFLQEHWLYPDSLSFLDSFHQDFTGWGRSSHNLNLDSIWRRGKGGIGILWRKSLDANITKLEDLGNDRIIAIQVRLSNNKMIYFIGVYLPATNQPIEQFRKYSHDLKHVVNILHQQGAVIVLGDFNGHIGTHGGPRSFSAINNPGLEIIHLIKRMGLLSVNSQSVCKGPIATYFAKRGTIATTTDHILVSTEFFEHVTDCYVQDDKSSNLSFHLPIFCTFDLDVMVKEQTPVERRSNLSWKLINNVKIVKRYQKNVEKSLRPLSNIPVSNLEQLEDLTKKFSDAVIASANKSIPRVKQRSFLKPYWNANLSSLHKETRRCRNEWISYGKPRSSENIFFINYKESKMKFRKLLRRKHLEYEIKDNEHLQKTFEIDRNRFQSTISRKHKGKSQCGNVLKVGDKLINDEDEVLDIWRGHYMNLYTPAANVEFDDCFQKYVEENVQKYCSESYDHHDDPLENRITETEVRDNCLKLPNGKTGGPDGLLYEHLKYAGHHAHVVLTRIYNATRDIEDVPSSSATGTIINLFKGKKKSKYDKDNYRGITLLNVIGKLLERIILNRSMPFFENLGLPNELQFAYQKSKSSVIASFVLQEAILDSIEKGSKVYTCLLDSAKAFDTV